MGEGVGGGVAVCVGVMVGVAVRVGEGVGGGVPVCVGVTVDVAVRVGVGVTVAVRVGVGATVAVAVRVGEGVEGGVAVAVGVDGDLGVAVGVDAGSDVVGAGAAGAEEVAPGVGWPPDPPDPPPPLPLVGFGSFGLCCDWAPDALALVDPLSPEPDEPLTPAALPEALGRSANDMMDVAARLTDVTTLCDAWFGEVMVTTYVPGARRAEKRPAESVLPLHVDGPVMRIVAATPAPVRASVTHPVNVVCGLAEDEEGNATAASRQMVSARGMAGRLMDHPAVRLCDKRKTPSAGQCQRAEGVVVTHSLSATRLTLDVPWPRGFASLPRGRFAFIAGAHTRTVPTARAPVVYRQFYARPTRSLDLP